MKTHLLYGTGLLACSLTFGCSKKAEGPPPSPASIVQPQEYTPVAAPTPGQSEDQADERETAMALQESEINAHAAMLTFMVQEYAAQNKRVPTDLQELVSAALLPAVPKLPPGWTFQIDAKNKQVTAVRQ